jgi:hypothetical protein
LLNRFNEREKRQVSTDCDDELKEEIPIEIQDPSCNSTEIEISEEITNPTLSLTTCFPADETTDNDSVSSEFECEETTIYPSTTIPVITTSPCIETDDTENIEISSESNTSESNCEEITEETTTYQVTTTTVCQPEGDITESEVTTEEFECEENTFTLTTTSYDTEKTTQPNYEIPEEISVTVSATQSTCKPEVNLSEEATE